MRTKEVIGGPVIINGQKLSLSKAIRAGDYLYLTGQIPLVNGEPMIDGTIEEQTEVVLNDINATLKESGCDLSYVVKAMIWLRDRKDFPGFNEIYGKFFPIDAPARSAVVSELLVDVKIEIEVVAFDPK